MRDEVNANQNAEANAAKEADKAANVQNDGAMKKALTDSLPSTPGDSSPNAAFSAMRDAGKSAENAAAAKILNNGFSIEDKATGSGGKISEGKPTDGSPILQGKPVGDGQPVIHGMPVSKLADLGDKVGSAGKGGAEAVHEITGSGKDGVAGTDRGTPIQPALDFSVTKAVPDTGKGMSNAAAGAAGGAEAVANGVKAATATK